MNSFCVRLPEGHIWMKRLGQKEMFKEGCDEVAGHPVCLFVIMYLCFLFFKLKGFH